MADKSSGKIGFISLSLIWKYHVTKKSFEKVETLLTRDLRFIVREDYQKWEKRDLFLYPRVSYNPVSNREDLKTTPKTCKHVADKDYFPRFILTAIYH